MPIDERDLYEALRMHVASLSPGVEMLAYRSKDYGGSTQLQLRLVLTAEVGITDAAMSNGVDPTIALKAELSDKIEQLRTQAARSLGGTYSSIPDDLSSLGPHLDGENSVQED